MWCIAKDLNRTLNSLNYGTCRRTRIRPRVSGLSDELSAAITRTHLLVLSESSKLARARRGLGLTGAIAASRLVTTDPEERYGKISKTTTPHTMMIASAIDEPQDEWTVNMLAALPQDERCFYEDEGAVIDYEFKSEILFNDLEEQYGFVGGTYEQCLAYFLRTDMPSAM